MRAYVIAIYVLISIYQLLHFPIRSFPFSINAGFVCLPFFYSGYFVANRKIEQQKCTYLSLKIICSGFVCMLTNYFDHGNIVSIWCGAIGNPLLFLVKAFSGICLVVFSAYLLERIFIQRDNIAIEVLGKNTIYVYIFHRVLVDNFELVKRKLMIYDNPYLDIINVIESIFIVVIISLVASMGDRVFSYIRMKRNSYES